MFVRAYLRASTAEQDATRAEAALHAFAAERGLKIAATYVENASGAALERPALRRLLRDAHPGDVLLVEQVDRLTRLSAEDWAALRAEISKRQLRLVALDVPTSWPMAASVQDEFTARMFSALNDLLLDVLAAVARKDWADRRRRQAEGQARAKAAGKYRGRPENIKRNNAIAALLRAGASWSEAQAATGACRGTVARVARRLREGAAAAE